MSYLALTVVLLISISVISHSYEHVLWNHMLWVKDSLCAGDVQLCLCLGLSVIGFLSVKGIMCSTYFLRLFWVINKISLKAFNKSLVICKCSGLQNLLLCASYWFKLFLGTQTNLKTCLHYSSLSRALGPLVLGVVYVLQLWMRIPGKCCVYKGWLTDWDLSDVERMACWPHRT